VTSQYEPLDEVSHGLKGCLELHHVSHAGKSLLRLEEMVVAKAAEKTFDHAVLKINWGLKFRDSTSVANHKSEMAPLPGDFLV